VTTRPEQQAEAEAKLLWKHFESLKRDPQAYRAALQHCLQVHFKNYARTEDGAELDRQLDSELLANLRYKYLPLCSRCGENVSGQHQPCGCFDLCQNCFDHTSSSSSSSSSPTPSSTTPLAQPICRHCKAPILGVQESDVMTKDQWSSFWKWFGSVETTIRAHSGLWNQYALHGVISRHEAEKLLHGQPAGVCLLRLCSTDPTALVIVLAEEDTAPNTPAGDSVVIRHVLVSGADLQDLGLGCILRELGLQKVVLAGESLKLVRREQLDLPGVARAPNAPKTKGNYVSIVKRPALSMPPIQKSNTANQTSGGKRGLKRKLEEPTSMDVDLTEGAGSPKRARVQQIDRMNTSGNEESEEVGKSDVPFASGHGIPQLSASLPFAVASIPCYWQASESDQRMAQISPEEVRSVADLQNISAKIFNWTRIPELSRCQWLYTTAEGLNVELPMGLLASTNAPLGSVLRLAKALWVRLL
jgi:hypothetical protein